MIEFIWNLKKSFNDEKGLDSKIVAAPVTWKPLGRLPSWQSKLNVNSSRLRVNRVNRYLAHQELRLNKYRDQKYYWKVAIIWCLLLKNSKAYQLSLFHRTHPTWYWEYSSNVTVKLLKECMNKARKWDMVITMRRFYIEKSNGKMRPIGSPTSNSAFISKAINDLIYYTYEDQMRTNQHGFRMGRGVHTALFEVWTRIFLANHREIYEFDFHLSLIT